MLYERRGQAHGQLLRESERRQLEPLLRLVAREPSCEHGQEIARLLQLLLEWRQRLLHLCQRGLLGRDVEPGNRPQLELTPEERERSGADVNDLLGGRDLRAQGGLLDGGRR